MIQHKKNLIKNPKDLPRNIKDVRVFLRSGKIGTGWYDPSVKQWTVYGVPNATVVEWEDSDCITFSSGKHVFPNTEKSNLDILKERIAELESTIANMNFDMSELQQTIEKLKAEPKKENNVKRPPYHQQVIRQCSVCGREQYDSTVDVPCGHVDVNGNVCPGVFIKAPKVKKCPNCGAIFGANSSLDSCPRNCMPVFLEIVEQ